MLNTEWLPDSVGWGGHAVSAYAPASASARVSIWNQPSQRIPVELKISVEWDAEGEVWVAYSDDVPGLIVQGDDLKVMFSEIAGLAPILLNENDVAWYSELMPLPPFTFRFVTDSE